MLSKPLSSQLYEAIDGVWFLIRQAKVYEARVTSRRLVQEIESLLADEDTALLRILVQACHAAGYATSMNTRNRDASPAIAYFQQMEEAARVIHDPILLTIALTYTGDTFRRCGDISQALTYLQAAYDLSSRSDSAAHGNCAQLLGRVYFQIHEVNNFERLMIEAEELAGTLSQAENTTHGQYSLGTVYVEYARSYSKRGNLQQAMDYLDRAEQVLPATPHWQTLLTATRAVLVTRGGDIQEGLPLVLKSVELCYSHGNMRLLEHLYALLHFLEKKASQMSKAVTALSEALHGPFEP